MDYSNTMQSPSINDYVEQVQAIVSSHKKLGGPTAGVGKEIRSLDFPEGRVHLMLRQIDEIAFDLAEDFRSKEANKLELEELKQILSDYVAHRWYPTTWGLSASYGELQQGYGVAVIRQNGTLTVTSGQQSLKTELEKLTKKVNPNQTDEWFLKNPG
jgi:hypothetical protein